MKPILESTPNVFNDSIEIDNMRTSNNTVLFMQEMDREQSKLDKDQGKRFESSNTTHLGLGGAVTRKSAKDYTLAPKYYVKDFDPRTVDPTSLPKHEEFVKIMKGPTTPVK